VPPQLAEEFGVPEQSSAKHTISTDDDDNNNSVPAEAKRSQLDSNEKEVASK
jgi:hypothetical protein